MYDDAKRSRMRGAPFRFMHFWYDSGMDDHRLRGKL